jgi:carbamoylphosphate synthase small subunit
MEDTMYSNLKLKLIVEKAKNKELTRNLVDIIRITGLSQGPITIQDRRKPEQIKILQEVSKERDQREMNDVEINICLEMIGGSLEDRLRK